MKTMLNALQKKSISENVKNFLAVNDKNGIEGHIKVLDAKIELYEGKIKFSNLVAKKYKKGFKFVSPTFDFMNDDDYLELMQEQYMKKVADDIKIDKSELEGTKLELTKIKAGLTRIMRNGK